MRVYLAADHAGFALKGVLIAALTAEHHEAIDLGAPMLASEDDYPDYILPLAERVAVEPGAFGIALGGSGQGEAMAANRLKGARAALWYGGPLDIIRLAREHNNANILSLGARFVGEEEATGAVRLFLATAFSGEERHIRRLAKF